MIRDLVLNYQLKLGSTDQQQASIVEKAAGRLAPARKRLLGCFYATFEEVKVNLGRRYDHLAVGESVMIQGK